MLIGENEMKSGKAELKNMKSGEKSVVNIGENFTESINSLLMDIDL